MGSAGDPSLHLAMNQPTLNGADPEQESAYHGRVLSSTSGNAQCLEKGINFDSGKPMITGSYTISDSQYLLPLPVLGSNDRDIKDHLAARKARRSSHTSHDRPYLRTEKYKAYRGRKRQDKGDDGKPVWPDNIEESFQNALVQIPPMGRKKKTQYGRPHGRNELIAEWIYQDTGEVRQRKQISSHIQVLNGFLKDIPEWQVLIAKTEDENNECKEELDCDYYYESIADQVRLQRQLAQVNKVSCNRDSWLGYTSQRHHLSKLTFELWVGAPDSITQALHNYTRVSNSHCPLPAVPLEDFRNWRELFPDLEATLHGPDHGEFDVILVKSTFALMSDFPLKSSKLGLVLNLDFRNPGLESIKALNELQYWSSVNHMYLNGRPLRKTEHNECQSAEFGLGKPFFEADWWAPHFTKVTHKRKEAENSADNSALAAADEYSRGLFRGLSIMQEVFASPRSDTKTGVPRRRMAVLLWIFSQAARGQSGVTNWQKLILPPGRSATNSPLAPPSTTDSSLPPLVLDSMVESSFDTTMTDHDFSLHMTDTNASLSPIVYEPGSYHSGFTPVQNMNDEHLQFYDFADTSFTPKPADFTDIQCESFDFNAPMQSISSSSRLPRNLFCRTQASNMFGNLSVQEDPNADFAAAQNLHPTGVEVVNSPDRRECLANFDVSTHQMLQAQLSRVSPQFESLPTDLYAMADLDSQQSISRHLGGLELAEGAGANQGPASASIVTGTSSIRVTDDQELALSHPTAFQSPRSSRPRLLAHNSFAGVLHGASAADRDKHEQLSFDTPIRNQFARIMANHFADSCDDDFFGVEDVSSMEFHTLTANDEIIRPRSQPVLPSNASPLGPREDLTMIETPKQRLDMQRSLKIEEE